MSYANNTGGYARRIAKCLAMLDADGQEKDTALTQLFKFIRADNGKFSDYFFFNLHTGDAPIPPTTEEELDALQDVVDGYRLKIVESRKVLTEKEAEASFLKKQIDLLTRSKDNLEDEVYNVQCIYYDQLKQKRPGHPRSGPKNAKNAAQNKSKVVRRKRPAYDNPFPKSQLPNNGNVTDFGKRFPHWKNIIIELDRGDNAAQIQLAEWLTELRKRNYKIVDVLVTKEGRDQNKKYLKIWRAVDSYHNSMESLLNEEVDLDYKIRCTDENLINLMDDRDSVNNDISSLRSQGKYYRSKVNSKNNSPKHGQSNASPHPSAPPPQTPGTNTAGAASSSSIGGAYAQAPTPSAALHAAMAKSFKIAATTIRVSYIIAKYAAVFTIKAWSLGTGLLYDGWGALSSKPQKMKRDEFKIAAGVVLAGLVIVGGGIKKALFDEDKHYYAEKPYKYMYAQQNYNNNEYLNKGDKQNIVKDVGKIDKSPSYEAPTALRKNMYVNADDMFVWAKIENDEGAELIWSFNYGDKVELVEVKDKPHDRNASKWVRVAVPGGLTGFVLISELSENKPATNKAKSVGRVEIGNNANKNRRDLYVKNLALG